MSYQQAILLFKVLLVLTVPIFNGASTRNRRGIYNFDGQFGYPNLGPVQVPVLPQSSIIYAKPVLVQKAYPSVSSAQIASAIQAAKEASSSVMAAQQRVQEAKEALLHQQHLASRKESAAILAQQKAEAAAAVQRQEAKSAATAVVMAQQRLAQAKSDVAEQQKMAAMKEAHAAAIIHKSAAVAEAEIQKSDHAAEKISALQNSQINAVRHASVIKDGSLSAASAAIEASSGHPEFPHQPWAHQKFFHFAPWN